MHRHGIEKWLGYAAMALIITGMVAGCAGGNEKVPVPADESILRIGVSTNYPPLIFKQDEDIKGADKRVLFHNIFSIHKYDKLY